MLDALPLQTLSALWAALPHPSHTVVVLGIMIPAALVAFSLLQRRRAQRRRLVLILSRYADRQLSRATAEREASV